MSRFYVFSSLRIDSQEERTDAENGLFNVSIFTPGVRNRNGDKYNRLESVEYDEYMDNPVVQRDHADYVLPIGKTLDLYKKDKSLWARFQMDMDDEDSARIAGKMARGYLKGVSTGTRALDYEFEDGDGSEGWYYGTNIERAKLREISVVNLPADAGAIIRNGEVFKSWDEEYERRLKEWIKSKIQSKEEQENKEELPPSATSWIMNKLQEAGYGY